MRVVEDLRNSLFAQVKQNSDTIVIGEDLLDPYGGAFKVTQGLSDAFPENVITSPISEAGLVGVGLGMALRGKTVVAEIMFGDFLTLTMDQLVNHAAKVKWMFNDAVDANLVIRTPMGGGRGYGPTHSQSLEKHFCGVPGLTVMAVNQFSSPGKLLESALFLGSPVLFIENKIMYSKLVEENRLICYDNPDALILTYGGVSEMCVRAAEKLLEEEEVTVEVVPIEFLSPLPKEQILKAAAKSDRIFIVEEGSESWGFGAACSEYILSAGILPKHFVSIAADPIAIPSARNWELEMLPNTDRIERQILNTF
jgi:pyruvate/2-oxoglutarate/acetoin dehydrogenase E1 component